MIIEILGKQTEIFGKLKRRTQAQSKPEILLNG